MDEWTSGVKNHISSKRTDRWQEVHHDRNTSCGRRLCDSKASLYGGRYREAQKVEMKDDVTKVQIKTDIRYELPGAKLT